MSNILEIVTNILKERNLDSIEISKIPNPDTLLGVKEASIIIKNAILTNKKIAIIGDYDVDGIASSCIMEYFFKEIGYFNFIVKIPNRFSDGYGINTNIIEEIDADIFITVDNGISAFEVAELCKSKNKILIITDHHKPLIKDDNEILPDAIVINPNQKSCTFLQKEICGALVAWYFCAGIKKELNANVNLVKLSAFVALAIISDIMPLNSINRAIFKLGLKEIKRSKINAFCVLNNRYNINSQTIGFTIAPILNSAGRIKDAQIALDFFRQNNDEDANKILESLININNERKNIQNNIFLQAKQNIKLGNNVVIASGEDWHEGVLGIVASKLGEEFALSAFCFSLKDGILTGSGRSKNGLNLIAAIQKCENILIKFGGHNGAVGLSLRLENLNDFYKIIDENPIIDNEIMETQSIELNLSDINIKLLDLLESYEPYGCQNKQIEFYINAVNVNQSQKIGKNKEHQILKFNQNNNLNGILFNNSDDFTNKNVSISFFIQRDKMTLNPQLMINSIKLK